MCWHLMLLHLLQIALIAHVFKKRKLTAESDTLLENALPFDGNKSEIGKEIQDENLYTE